MSTIIQVQDSRRTFIDALIELAERDSNIILATCDVGFNYLTNFQERFPDRFLNLGVTEQSAIMICVGLATEGMKPYFYSMINFVLFRPAEMVRNGIVCHKVPVTLIGVKGSSSYKFLGFSHNLLHPKEDINFCKNIGLDSYIPKNNKEVKKVIKWVYESNKPAYVRL